MDDGFHLRVSDGVTVGLTVERGFITKAWRVPAGEHVEFWFSEAAYTAVGR